MKCVYDSSNFDCPECSGKYAPLKTILRRIVLDDYIYRPRLARFKVSEKEEIEKELKRIRYIKDRKQRDVVFWRFARNRFVNLFH